MLPATYPPSRHRTTCRAIVLCLTLLSGLLWTGSASAAPCDPAHQDCVAPGTWSFKVAIGAGVRTNPVVGGDNIPLVVLPQITYYGKRFFWDNLDLGYTLIDQPQWMLNALVTADTDGLYFFNDDWGRFFLDGSLSVNQSFSPAPSAADEFANEGHPQNPPTESNQWVGPARQPAAWEPTPLRDRHVAALGGLESSGDLGGGLQWQFQLLSDISGVHEGQTVRFALSSTSPLYNGQLGIATGLNWKSAEIMEYYYGVTQGEAMTGRPAYRPDSGTSPFLRLSWSRPVSDRWQWLGSVQYEHLSNAMRHSPLIDQDEILQFFVGGVYHF